MTDTPVFTVKEWLQRLDQKIDSLDEKLDNKVDVAVVVALEARVRELEQTKADKQELSALGKQFLTFIVGSAGAVFVWALTVLRGAGKF